MKVRVVVKLCPLAPANWYCHRREGHPPPCALEPCWWNLGAQARQVRRAGVPLMKALIRKR